MTQTKFCPVCGVTQPLADYYSNRSKSGGLDSMCKECRKSNNKTYMKKNPNYNHEYYLRVIKPKRKAARKLRLEQSK